MPVLPENWHTRYLEDAYFYFAISFLNFQPLIHFGEIWVEKFKVVRFSQKFAHRVSRGCSFLFRHWFSEFPILIPLLGEFGAKNSKLFVLPENWHTEYLEDVIAIIPRKVWKEIQKWKIVLSAGWSCIFIVAKGRNWNNHRKNVGWMRL